MLVKATEMSSKLKVRIKELHRIVNEGEIFDVSPMRFEVLSGKNKFKAVFVKEVVDENVIVVDDLLKEEDQKEQTSKKENKDTNEVDKVLGSMGISRMNVDTELKVGRKVKIIAGPFNGMFGKIDSVDLPNQKVMLTVDLFGQETSVEVELSQIENLK